VVNAEGRLVGILTEHDFMDLSAALLERWLQED
jgi:CBS domain-containing protein